MNRSAVITEAADPNVWSCLCVRACLCTIAPETSVGYNVVLRELGVVLRVWLLDASAASLPVDLETMEAFGSRGEESNHAIWGPGQDPGQKPKR